MPLDKDLENPFGLEGRDGSAMNGFVTSAKVDFEALLLLRALPGEGMAEMDRLFSAWESDGVNGVFASFRERREGVFGFSEEGILAGQRLKGMAVNNKAEPQKNSNTGSLFGRAESETYTVRVAAT